MNTFTQAVQNFLSKNPVETIKEFHLIDIDGNMIMEGKHGCSVRGMRVNTIHLVDKHFPNLHRAHSIGLTNRAFKF